MAQLIYKMGKDREINDLPSKVPYENDKIIKSNFLIGAKYGATLLENKITFAALYQVQKGLYQDTDKGYVVEMRTSELRNLIDSKSGSIYSQLEPVAQNMAGRLMGISDPVSERFEYIPLLQKAKYEDGIFTITFNKELKDHIVSIEKNFTSLNKRVMMSFTSTFSFRLYEILKSKCYYAKGAENENGLFTFDIGLAELKLQIGVVNAELDAVKKELSGKVPNYEAALRRSPEKKYDRWVNFKERVLDRAIEEINENKEAFLHVDYEPLRGGKGGKIYAIRFIVTRYDMSRAAREEYFEKELNLEKNTEKKQLTEDERMDVVIEVTGLLKDHDFKSRDIRTICEEAEYNYDAVAAAYEAYIKSPVVIENPVGWIISFIRSDGYGNYSKRETLNSGFPERNYSKEFMESLERSLLNCQ